MRALHNLREIKSSLISKGETGVCRRIYIYIYSLPKWEDLMLQIWVMKKEKGITAILGWFLQKKGTGELTEIDRREWAHAASNCMRPYICGCVLTSLSVSFSLSCVFLSVFLLLLQIAFRIPILPILILVSSFSWASQRKSYTPLPESESSRSRQWKPFETTRRLRFWHIKTFYFVLPCRV